MKRYISWVSGICAATILAFAAPASAALWTVNYTSIGGAPLSAQLNITTSNVLNVFGNYDITAISGNLDGEAITGLLANGNQPGTSTVAGGLWTIDNNLRPTAPWFDNAGLGFMTATRLANLFSVDPAIPPAVGSPTTNYTMGTSIGGGYSNFSDGTVEVSGSVPEPATWAFMILGFGGAGMALRRKRRAVTAFA